MVYRFGTFELDSARGELCRNGRRVAVQEKPLIVLTALLEHAGEVVERETLRQRLWTDDFHVDVENGINAAVGRLREALGDSASRPLFVATVPRRGYRFVAPLLPDPAAELTLGAPTSVSHPAPRTRFGASPWLVALATLAAVAGITWLGFRPGPGADHNGDQPFTGGESPPPIRLAVLPFIDLGDGAVRSDLADGLTGEIISTLGRLQPERLRVIASTSVASYRDTPPDLAVISHRLDVAFVVEGTVQREGSTVRVTAALVEVAGQTRRWSATYDRALTSLMALEREMATEIVGALAIEVGVTASGEVSSAASELLLRGQAQLARRTEAGFRQALRTFESALAEDPDASSAYAGLATAWAFLGVWDQAPREQAYPNAKRWAERTLRLDPASASGHLVMAAVHFLYEWRFEAAAASFANALALNPSAADAQLFAASFWASQGQTERAISAAEQAVALDPLSPSVHAEACWLLFSLDREAAAVAHCHRALDLEPAFLEAWDNLKWLHIRRGDENGAISAFLKVVELEATHAAELDDLRAIAAREGLAGLLRASLEDPAGRLRESGQSPYNLALDHAALGEVEEALQWLERAYGQRETDLVHLAVDPRLDALRQAPRFEALLRRVGLVPTTPGQSAERRQKSDE